MEFGKKLKEQRRAHGLSQMQLATATGISQSAIAKWELERTEPTASMIIALAKFFGVTTDSLLGYQKAEAAGDPLPCGRKAP